MNIITKMNKKYQLKNKFRADKYNSDYVLWLKILGKLKRAKSWLIFPTGISSKLSKELEIRKLRLNQLIELNL